MHAQEERAIPTHKASSQPLDLNPLLQGDSAKQCTSMLPRTMRWVLFIVKYHDFMLLSWFSHYKTL